MNENTKIVQCYLPNIEAGLYQVAVEQKIGKTGSASPIETVNKNFDFGVDAARFTLNSDDIYSVYPPANTTGRYDNQLPHIVFSRRTLPWERTINGKLPAFKEQSKTPIDIPPIPWMALLLFNDEEMKDLKINVREISEVLELQNDKVARPQKEGKEEGLSLMAWERDNQKCLTIDLTKAQFEKYVPKMDSLSFQAHSKEVKITHKDKNGIADVEGETGYFSLLIGNRIIKDKKGFTAIVVSLEGHQDYIKDSTSIKGEHVRMVVLSNWNFNNDGDKTFETLINGIQYSNMSMKHHLESSSSGELTKAIQHGYTPMNHFMRNGAKTMSWYRGPFVPDKIDFSKALDNVSFSSSDRAMRYDTDTGLFDVSIAAAWELGKVLALKNPEFTKAIVTWNSDPIHHSDQKALPPISPKNILMEWLDEIEEDGLMLNNQVSFKPLPKSARLFLASLAKLEGVPISYLIPDKKYITVKGRENGVMSLFYVDPLWIHALLDGALSLGRPKRNITKVILEDILKKLYGTGPITGLLLHSRAVSGWRGMEFRAFDSRTLLKSVRFERITDNIFLGVFKGIINKIILTQPYEGLHFGVKEGTQALEKAIRNSKTGAADGDNTVEIAKANHPHIDSGVLKTSVLASALNVKTKDPVFTSSEYAFQMIDSPLEFSIEIKLT